MNVEQLEKLNSGSKPKILVIGDLMVDCHVHCEVLGLSPEDELTPKLRECYKKYTPGGAANVALNLKTMGAEPMVAGITGFDGERRTLDQLLCESAVPHILVADPSRPTTLKTRYVTPHGRHICRIDRENSQPVQAAFLSEMIDCLQGSKFNAVIISDYAKGVISHDVMSFARSFDVPIVVDPKGNDFYKYGKVFAITPNANEFETDNHALYIVQTLAEQGCRVWRRDDNDTIHKPFANVPTRARHLGDPTGCGDSFIAAFTLAISKGWSVVEACVLGNAAGAVSFDHTGAHAVRFDQLLSEVIQMEGVKK